MGQLITVTVTGQESVERAYRTIADGAADMPATQADVGSIAKTAARAAAPKRTGWLAATISSRPEADRVILAAGAVYGGVIEWGWAARRIRGQHYMLRGIRGATAQIVAAYDAGLSKVVATAQAGE